MFTSLRRRLPQLGRWTRRLLAAGCLVLAALSALDARSARTRSAPGAVPVVVAARALPAGRLLSVRDLTVHQLAPGSVPAGIRAGPGSLAGRRLAGPVTAGEPITSARLLGRDLVTGLPASTVALPVTVADAHTADLLSAGDRIDLVTTAPAADTDIPDIPSAAAASAGGQIIATRLLVLAVQRYSDAEASRTSLVVATDRTTAVRITRAQASQGLAALGLSP